MADDGEPYVLYHNSYSVCSIMVRYTIAVAGEPKDASSGISIKEEDVDIYNSAQLDEHFLCKINSKGQVPVLAPPAPEKPIPDSVKITEFLGERYPALYPESHRKEVEQLLEALHGINYFTLTFGSRPQMAQNFLTAINSRLDGEISDEYRKALEYKLSVTQTEKEAPLKTAPAAANEFKTRELMTTFASHLSKDSPWLFGLAEPSALDAHLVVFIARMKDVNRYDLFPEELKRYGEAAWETEAFQKVMDGRKTVKPSS